MDDWALYQRLGEVIGKLDAAGDRLDEVVSQLKEQDKRVKSLEESRATAKGHISSMRNLAHAAFVIASALGVERIVQLIGWPHV